VQDPRKRQPTRSKRPRALSHRMSNEDVDVLQELADQMGLSQADIIHLALRDYAQKHLRVMPESTP
jgi:Ribbon-helix-helix protein, copG family